MYNWRAQELKKWKRQKERETKENVKRKKKRQVDFLHARKGKNKVFLFNSSETVRLTCIYMYIIHHEPNKQKNLLKQNYGTTYVRDGFNFQNKRDVGEWATTRKSIQFFIIINFAFSFFVLLFVSLILWLTFLTIFYALDEEKNV